MDHEPVCRGSMLMGNAENILKKAILRVARLRQLPLLLSVAFGLSLLLQRLSYSVHEGRRRGIFLLANPHHPCCIIAVSPWSCCGGLDCPAAFSATHWPYSLVTLCILHFRCRMAKFLQSSGLTSYYQKENKDVSECRIRQWIRLSLTSPRFQI